MDVTTPTVMCIDWECQPKANGGFPEASEDPILQMSCTVSRGKQQWFYMFMLGSCQRVYKGDNIFCYNNEHDMFTDFFATCQRFQIDWYISWNGSNFDWPYLLDRAAAIGFDPKNIILGRYHEPSTISNGGFKSRAHVSQEKTLNVPGAIHCDMMQYAKKTYKWENYKLETALQMFLGEGKEDMDYTQIPILQQTEEGRTTLYIYARKDTMGPTELFRRWSMWENHLLLSRITGVDIKSLLTRGQQYKGFAMYLKYGRDRNVILQTFKKNHLNEDDEKEESEGFEGAIVIEAKKGLYDESGFMISGKNVQKDARFDGPVITLDFASLYPSIMRAHNLSQDTWVSPKTIKRLDLKKGIDYWQRPNMEINSQGKPIQIDNPRAPCFMTKPIKKGLLGKISFTGIYYICHP